MVERFQVGYVASTHGIGGEVNVFATTEDPRRFRKLKNIRLQTLRGEVLDLEIERVKMGTKFVILKFKGYDNINDVERWKGSELTIDRADAIPLRKGEYYIPDLIGLDIQDEDGNYLGKLVNVIQTGANDVYEMQRDGVDETGKPLDTVLIPKIDECVLNIDIEKGVVTIHVMDGLM